MPDSIRAVRILAASILIAGCATASPAAGPRGPVAILDERELRGCTWERIGTVIAEARSGVMTTGGDELRRDLSRRAASMNADAVIDVRVMQVGPVGGRAAGARSTTISRATGVAIRFTSVGCPAGARA